MYIDYTNFVFFNVVYELHEVNRVIKAKYKKLWMYPLLTVVKRMK
jgi:hypothetical protein